MNDKTSIQLSSVWSQSFSRYINSSFSNLSIIKVASDTFISLHNFSSIGFIIGLFAHYSVGGIIGLLFFYYLNELVS